MNLSSAAREDGHLALSLLGPFEATHGDQRLSFATDATRVLLAYLAVEADRPHRREFLAALLWPDQPQAAAFANLRQTLVRLRAGLPEPAAASVMSVTRQTLEIHLDGVDLDTARFARLIADCADHPHRDLTRCRACVQRLERAWSLYRGEFLEGMYPGSSQLFEEWVIVRREQFHRQALEALRTLANHYETVGDYESMRRSAERQLTLEPWREEAHRQKMRALVLQGERAAAIDQYETCRRVLAQELGIEPDSATRAMYDRIRDNDLTPEMLREPAPTHNLPVKLTPFIGRERELEDIDKLLDDPGVRLLTLVGTGGMGKTRLALETAYRCLNRYPEGVFFVSLAPLLRHDMIASTIATTMGMSLDGDIQKVLPSALRDKQALLVLDNFDHLLEGVGIIVELLESAPGLQFIVTSRERLNVPSEHVYVVHGLDYGESPSQHATPASATRLFAQCVRRVQPDFAVRDENLHAVTRICKLVEGMPLGIELAAAWADMLPLDEIAREIERSVDFLSSDWRETPEQHRSLRTVFDGSWRSLDASERQVFCQLSAFRGGFTREAAQSVTGASLRALMRLAHKSLLFQRGGRYQIHELLRQFGAEQLDSSAVEQRTELEARHSAYYLAFVAQRQTALDGDQPQQVAGEIWAEIDNIRRAWNSAVQRRQFTELDETAIGLWRFWSLSGHNHDLEQLMRLSADQLETHAEENDAHRGADARSCRRAVSKLRAIQAAALIAQGDHDSAIPISERAIALGQASRGIEGEAFGYLANGQALVQKAQYPEAQLCLEQALTCARQSSSSDGPMESLHLMEYLVHLWQGAIATRQSEHTRAADLFERSLDVCRQRGDLRGEMHSLANLGNAARSAHQYAASRDYHECALHLARDLGYRWGEARTQVELADVARLQGDPELARQLAERSLTLCKEIGDRLGEAVSLAYLGRLHTYLGDDTASQECLDRLLQVVEVVDVPFVNNWGWIALAARHYHMGDVEQALVYAERAIAAAEAVGTRVDQADALVTTGMILASMNRLDEATCRYLRAIALCDALDSAAEVITSRSGLALVCLAEHAWPEALAYAEKLLANLSEHAGGDQPFAVYLTCYRVLDAIGDSRALEVLLEGHRQLLEYADRIVDGPRRRSFLENVTAHRELRRAYEDRVAGGVPI